jgi:regulator of replication initiation timing
MLYQFLSNSLTESAKTILLNQTEKYIINGTKDGLCFLRTIIAKAHVDSISTVDALRIALSSLDQKMIELKGGIQEFHIHVRQIVNALAAYSEGHDELMANLFKAYAVVNDDEFREYIRSKRYTHEDVIRLTANSLMTHAENHYNSRIANGTWKVPDKKVERIVALEAEIKQLKTVAANTTATSTNSETKWAWKKKAPKDGEPKTKLVNGTTFHWCPNHTSWTVHSPEQCEGILPRGTRPTGKTAAAGTKKFQMVPKMQMDPAMEVVVTSGGSMTK